MKKLLLVAALSAPLLSGCIVAVSDGEVEHGWASEYNGGNWQSQQKENRKMLDDLKEGDNVVTLSGIHGTIKKLKDDIVVLQIDNNVRIKINRTSIGATRESGKG